MSDLRRRGYRIRLLRKSLFAFEQTGRWPDVELEPTRRVSGSIIEYFTVQPKTETSRGLTEN